MSRGERHPVDDFLFEYYPNRPSLLRRWHPGLGRRNIFSVNSVRLIEGCWFSLVVFSYYSGNLTSRTYAAFA